jgi:hypothetical protein
MAKRENDIAVAVLNDAYVVGAGFLSQEFVPPELDMKTVIDATVEEWSLNTDQERAFRIIANHACLPAPEQLLMHLGGMAGMGKSRVFNALKAFFEKCKEHYRLVMLAPTGSAAALIGGLTYHSFFGLRSGWSSTSETQAGIPKLTERMIGVAYMLLDEVSMVGCKNTCDMSVRCCEALKVYNKPFSGLNVILAGDFAHLLPPGEYELYSRKVTLQHSHGQGAPDQVNTIGKLIWHQSMTVVILKENMQQTEDGTSDEEVFCQALINLRYNTCTPQDLALLQSRIPALNPAISIDNDEFRQVSIITAENCDKD